MIGLPKGGMAGYDPKRTWLPNTVFKLRREAASACTDCDLTVQAALATGVDRVGPAVCIVIATRLHGRGRNADPSGPHGSREGQPVASVSLGLLAMFRFSAGRRSTPMRAVRCSTRASRSGPGRLSQMAFRIALPVPDRTHPASSPVALSSARNPARHPDSSVQPLAPKPFG